MGFLIANLEIIVAPIGGLFIGGIMFFVKSKNGENDLTQLYIKYKKHSDRVNKSTKTIF